MALKYGTTPVKNVLVEGEFASTVKGNGSLSLPNAKANSLTSVTASGSIKRSLLPDGYTQYDYITVNGDCYYITDYYPTNLTEIKTKTFVYKQPTSPIVCRWSGGPTNDTFGFYMGNVSGRMTFFYGRYSDSKYLNIESVKLNIEHNIYVGVNSITFDSTSYSITRDTFTSTEPLYIGAFNQTGTSLAGMMYGRIYPVELIEGGKTVRHYIPCKNDNGAIGLYEAITGTFISSADSGTAKKGKPTINLDTIPSTYTRLEFLQSTGTQYIDSGITGNFANNKIEQTAVVQYTTSTSNRELMGTNGYGFWGKNASNKIEAALGQTTVTDNALVKNVINWTTDPDGNKLTLNVNSNQYTSTASTFVDASYTYYVFALGIRVGSGAAASFFCNAKVYEYAISIDNEVVSYLIPCKRNADNVLGMYDVVTGTFKTNAGTGTFTAGGIQATPSTTNPLPIVSNNGELKVSKNLVKEVYAGGMSASKVYLLGSTPLSGSYTTTSGWKGICAIVPVVAGKTYVRSGSVTNASYRYTSFYANYSDVRYATNALSTVTTTSFTVPSGATYAVVAWITENSGTTVTYSNLQVELGSTATDYSPYGETYTEGITETITDSASNSATAEMLLSMGDNADTQEILTGAVTRKVGVIVLDGTEDWGVYATNNGYRSFRVNNFLAAKTRDALCTHLPYYNFSSSAMDRECVAIGGNKTTFYINLAGEERTANDLKAWLANQYAAGTPVIIIYPLATQTTETVTGQTLNTVSGNNTLTITKASIENLPIEAQYTVASGEVNYLVKDTTLVWANPKIYLEGPGTYTVVGSPTITNGVLTGFNANNYLKFDSITFAPGSGPFEFQLDYTTGTSATDYGYSMCLPGINVNQPGGVGRFRVNFRTTSENFYLETNKAANTNYVLKVTYNGNGLYSLYSNGVLAASKSSTELNTTADAWDYTIGIRENSTTASINLNNTYVKVGNSVLFGKMHATQDIAPVYSGLTFGSITTTDTGVIDIPSQTFVADNTAMWGKDQ